MGRRKPSNPPILSVAFFGGIVKETDPEAFQRGWLSVLPRDFAFDVLKELQKRGCIVHVAAFEVLDSPVLTKAFWDYIMYYNFTPDLFNTAWLLPDYILDPFYYFEDVDTINFVNFKHEVCRDAFFRSCGDAV